MDVVKTVVCGVVFMAFVYIQIDDMAYGISWLYSVILFITVNISLASSCNTCKTQKFIWNGIPLIM